MEGFLLEKFLMFYAPFIVIFLSVAAAFWAAGKDDAVKK